MSTHGGSVETSADVHGDWDIPSDTLSEQHRRSLLRRLTNLSAYRITQQTALGDHLGAGYALQFILVLLIIPPSTLHSIILSFLNFSAPGFRACLLSRTTALTRIHEMMQLRFPLGLNLSC
ncbi:unnamed protein product [Pleuronectes platessa]|uniref:Uncharacterized protein n=1 Tax=Pleuronectes platessa TaxID=8262 RepID=A0A9N7UR64_PLEPL|nr:unnamed protein product [Pleuronectes platessa]